MARRRIGTGLIAIFTVAVALPAVAPSANAGCAWICRLRAGRWIGRSAGDAKDQCGFAAKFNIEVHAGLARLLVPSAPHAQENLRLIAGLELTR
jgi:hypothetical protein